MKKYFSFSLFKQGIKKTRGIGIATAATIIVFNFLYAFVTTQGFKESSGMIVVEKVEGGMIAPFLAVVFLFIPSICLSMFSYLNERKGADFYDSIPHKRTTVFISFTMAILTWVICTLVGSTLLNLLIWAVSPYFSPSVGGAALLVLNYLISSLVLIGITLTSRCLSGRSSIVLDFALSIIFIPRIILTFFEGQLSELNPVVIVERTFLNKISLNNSFLGIVGKSFGNSTSHLTRIPLLIGLFIEAILFLVLAVYLYNKRESQMAGQSVSSKWVKFFFRALLTIPLTFLIVTTTEPSLIVVLLSLTILLHFLYELFLSKDALKAAKSLPTLFVPLLISLALLLGVNVTSQYYINEDPSIDEVESVYLYTNEYYNKEFTFFCEKTLTGKESIAVTVSALENSYSRGEDYYGWGQYSDYEVEFTLKSGKKIYRKVYFLDKELIPLKLEASQESLQIRNSEVVLAN